MTSHSSPRQPRARVLRFMRLARLRCEFLEERVVPTTTLPDAGGQLFALDPTQYRSDDILVCFDPDAQAASVIRMQAAPGTEIGEEIPLIAGLHVVHLGAGVSVGAALTAYQANPLVSYAQPDYRVHLQFMPNDPQFASQWDFNNTGQTGGTPGADIQGPLAWDQTTGTGQTVVAVIDTGVDYNHPDLAANIWSNSDEIAGNGVDDDHNGYVDDIRGWDFVNSDNNPMDDNNHGTHVAGTIGAVGNNGVGIAGVDWHVKIMPLKILDASGSGSTSDVIRALNYAVANGAMISNNSYGGDPFSQALYDAINKAASAGHIYVAAAGNGNFLGIGQNNDQTPFYPANYNLPNVVAVAATDSNDELAFFSNYGKTTVDLAAPGVGILSTTRNNTYSVFDGTSMATPHVTGALALVRDLHPDWTYQQVINQVLNTVDPLPSLQGKTVTGGRLNLARAVLDPPVIDLNWTGGALTGPAAADWQVPFTVARTYTIGGEAAQHDFSISYYASGDTVFGNADDVLLGTESVTAAADKSIGAHSGTSPGLQILSGGTYRLFAKLDAGRSIFETDEQNNDVMAAQPVVVTGPVVVDNAQAGYSETGTGWQASSLGYAAGLRYHASGTGADTAVWQAPGLAPGYYLVQSTWIEDNTRATNAPYSIYDGSTLLATVPVNQKSAPSGTTWGGATFQNLATIRLTTGNLKIVLSDQASGSVVADAIRLVPIAAPTIDLNWVSGGISGPAATDTQSAFTISRTYTIGGEAAAANFTIAYYASTDATFGNADDILLGSETMSTAAEKSVGSHSGTSPNLQITTGGTYSLFARIDGANSLSETDENNNLAQATQPILVSTPVILDNAQSAYSETGAGWQSWSLGYAGSLRYHAAGSGANTAAWQATGLAPGYYLVQATWNADANHASNAAFSILDGAIPIQSVQVDQRPAPIGASVGGVVFQKLATVQVTSGTLRVTLSDSSNGNVVADAVRIVPLPAPTTDLNWGGGGIIGPAATDFQSTFTINRAYAISGTPVAGDFSISYYASSDATFGNTDDLLLGSETITAIADKAVGSHSGTSPSLQIATGGIYSLFARVDGGGAILETDESNNVVQASQTLTVAGPVIVDNAQSGYSETGSGWLSWGLGYAGSLRYKSAGSGANTATWQASGLDAGYYQVQATWNADANHASNAPFSIYDGAVLQQTVVVDERPAPTGTSAGGVVFQKLATVHITSGTLRVTLTDGGNGYTVADAIRIVPLPPPTIDLNWTGGGITGPAATDFQSTFTVNRNYTISGTPATSDFAIAYYASADATFGNADDMLLGSEAITAVADKTVGSHAGASPALQITTGGTYYLFARIDSGAAVLETDESNNIAQAPQTLSVAGPVIVDNAQSGYSETGSGWLSWGLGYAGNLRYKAAGNGSNTANWQTALGPGYYQVQATWNADGNHASNAPFRIYDGTTLVQTIAVDQRPAPTGTSVGGVVFQTLATVQISSGTLKVTLADAGNGYTVADAVRVVPLPAPTTDLNWSGGGITAPAATDFQSTFTVSRNYTISGAPATGDFAIAYYASTDAVFGNSDDVLLATEVLSATADKSVGSHGGSSPNLQIATGGVYYLFARLDSAGAVLETDEANNVVQSGQTIAVAGPVIVDNSHAGYSETGSGWLSWGLGYGGNLRYHAAGSGANTATWQATGLDAGYYQVQATWNADANHATNAPFRIYDGTTLLQTVLVDQRPAPSGTAVGGVVFQKLLTVQVASGTLRVVLSDGGNGYVVADAVRLVPSVSSSEFAQSMRAPTGLVAVRKNTPFLDVFGPPVEGVRSRQLPAARLLASASRGPARTAVGLLQALADWTPRELDRFIDLNVPRTAPAHEAAPPRGPSRVKRT